MITQLTDRFTSAAATHIITDKSSASVAELKLTARAIGSSRFTTIECHHLSQINNLSVKSLLECTYVQYVTGALQMYDMI